MSKATEIQKRITQHQAKINAAHYDLEKARLEINHLVTERQRVEALIDLDEASSKDLQAIDKRLAAARKQEATSEDQLRRSRTALGVLQERLEEATAEDEKATFQQALVEYQGTAQDLLELLKPVKEKYEQLREISNRVRYGPVGTLNAVSKAGNGVTDRLPEYLHKDLKVIEATLEKHAQEHAEAA